MRGSWLSKAEQWPSRLNALTTEGGGVSMHHYDMRSDKPQRAFRLQHLVGENANGGFCVRSEDIVGGLSDGRGGLLFDDSA